MLGSTNGSDGRVRLMACGDNNLQARKDPASAYLLVKKELAAADVLFGDNEMCLYNPKAAIMDKPGWIQSDEGMVEGLVAARFDVMSCANNVNYGDEAILSSRRVLLEHGIANTGTGSNREEARVPAIVTRKGVRFGFIARTAVFFPHGHAAGQNSPGVATIKCHTAYEPHPRAHELPGAPPTVRSWPDPRELDELREDVERLRPQVDVLVTYFHWGVSGDDQLAEYQQILGHDMVDHGANLVIGSHAHRPQGIEWHKGTPIAYGLGNFAFDWHQMARWRSGLLLSCDFEDKSIRRVSFKPVWRREDQLNQPEVVGLDHARGREIVDRVIDLSAQLGTKFVVEQDEVVLVA